MVVLASFYYLPHFGGVENSLFYLAKEFQKLGYQVIILVSDADLSKRKRLPPREVLDGIEVHRFRQFNPMIRMFALISPMINVFRASYYLKELKKNNQIELVVARNHIMAMACQLRSLQIKYLVPGIIKTQNRHKGVGLAQKILAGLKNFSVLQEHWIQKLVLRKVDVLVFSKNMGSQIAHLGTKDYTVVKPGVDFNRFKPREEKEVRSTSFTFVIIARITVHKNIGMAIDAIAKVAEIHPVRLVIVGVGPERNRLEHQVLKGNMKQLVSFEGQTENPEYYYQKADAFLMTSMHETFGQTIVEAMACGLPIIGFNSGKHVLTATNEIMEDGKNGILCDFGVDNLAEAMKSIISMDKKEIDIIKNNNLKRIKNKNNWNDLAIRLLE